MSNVLNVSDFLNAKAKPKALKKKLVAVGIDEEAIKIKSELSVYGRTFDSVSSFKIAIRDKASMQTKKKVMDALNPNLAALRC